MTQHPCWYYYCDIKDTWSELSHFRIVNRQVTVYFVLVGNLVWPRNIISESAVLLWPWPPNSTSNTIFTWITSFELGPELDVDLPSCDGLSRPNFWHCERRECARFCGDRCHWQIQWSGIIQFIGKATLTLGSADSAPSNVNLLKVHCIQVFSKYFCKVSSISDSHNFKNKASSDDKSGRCCVVRE